MLEKFFRNNYKAPAKSLTGHNVHHLAMPLTATADYTARIYVRDLDCTPQAVVNQQPCEPGGRHIHKAQELHQLVETWNSKGSTKLWTSNSTHPTEHLSIWALGGGHVQHTAMAGVSSEGGTTHNVSLIGIEHVVKKLPAGIKINSPVQPINPMQTHGKSKMTHPSPGVQQEAFTSKEKLAAFISRLMEKGGVTLAEELGPKQVTGEGEVPWRVLLTMERYQLAKLLALAPTLLRCFPVKTKEGLMRLGVPEIRATSKHEKDSKVAVQAVVTGPSLATTPDTASKAAAIIRGVITSWGWKELIEDGHIPTHSSVVIRKEGMPTSSNTTGMRVQQGQGGHEGGADSQASSPPPLPGP